MYTHTTAAAATTAAAVESTAPPGATSHAVLNTAPHLKPRCIPLPQLQPYTTATAAAATAATAYYYRHHRRRLLLLLPPSPQHLGVGASTPWCDQWNRFEHCTPLETNLYASCHIYNLTLLPLPLPPPLLLSPPLPSLPPPPSQHSSIGASTPWCD